MPNLAATHVSIAARTPVRALAFRYRFALYAALVLLAATLVAAEARNRNGAPYPVDDRPLVLPER